MKDIVLILFISLVSIVSCKGLNQSSFIYWEDMTKTEQDNILHSPTIYKNAVKYYLGAFKATDNKATEELLNKITSNDIPNREAIFYFYVFNQICLKSDGALSEILGGYCMTLMLMNPKFTLLYFKKNSKVEKKYAELMGYELFFKEEGTSDIEYNYKDFKKAIETKIKNDQKYKEILSIFYKDIEVVMKNMN